MFGLSRCFFPRPEILFTSVLRLRHQLARNTSKWPTKNCIYLPFLRCPAVKLILHRVVASAVVVPEEAQPVSQASPPPQETNGSLKRRQSSVSSISSKRPRLSADGVGEAISPPRDAPPPNRKASLKMDSQEERNRGRRLFGNVLGALSQRSTTAAQRKRAEIEKKAQEKQRMRVEEDEAVRKERLEALNRKRRKEQVVWDERSMKIRHENIRATARFLRTDAEPRLVGLRIIEVFSGCGS